jgi:hypothetical protein
MVDDQAKAREDRRKLTKTGTAAVVRELPQVNPNMLTAWDRAALAKVVEIQRATEQDEYEAALKRVFELAGLNYEIEQQNFWRRYHARAKRKQS